MGRRGETPASHIATTQSKNSDLVPTKGLGRDGARMSQLGPGPGNKTKISLPLLRLHGRALSSFGSSVESRMARGAFPASSGNGEAGLFGGKSDAPRGLQDLGDSRGAAHEVAVVGAADDNAFTGNGQASAPSEMADAMSCRCRRLGRRGGEGAVLISVKRKES